MPQAILEKFLIHLVARPSTDNLFNPWRDFDPNNDCRPDAPDIRLHHLKEYLLYRLSSAKILLIAEAPGYQSVKFSGLAFTSEAALIEAGADTDMFGDPFFEGKKERTSKDMLNYRGRIRQVPEGMVEPTATVIWTTMMALGFPPESFVGWNSFAWHPHLPDDRLSNRTPTISEIEQGQPVLQSFLDLFPGRKIVSIGNTCKRTLARMGIEAVSVRHPAYGGASQFRTQMAALASQLRIKGAHTGHRAG